MPEPADHTATLAPRGAPIAASESSPIAARVESLPVDDPDRYEQIGEHARGGLGRVVRAIDKRLGRTVAVKELLRHDEWHEARFVREALITARLEHPGIVPVHEAGRWPNGDPYYVMKLVEGRTLKELLAERRTLRDRLSLLSHVIAIADAVGYAHSEGVIHRDLKPSNVIVGEFGETIVVDWGLARDRKQELPEPAAPHADGSGSGPSSISGKVVGTPAYMAPEQARGELVDERADVYAIGALLYELLAGAAPHAGIPNTDTPTPQAVLERVIAGPPQPLCHAAPNVPPELADIVGKAMQRSPLDRYSNASALAEDLRRFQTGKLVSAHAYTPWHLVRKKLAQHRGVVVVALASAIALGAIGVESFRTVVAERDIARSERARAETARRSVEEQKRELTFVQAETSLRKDPTAALAWLKSYLITDHDLPHVVDVVDEAVALGVARHVFRPGDWVHDAAFTPDGKTIVAVVRDGSVRTYDLATGAMTIIGHTPSASETVAISPLGDLAITGGTTGEVIAWPLHGGPARTLVERGRTVTSLSFDPTCTKLIVDRKMGPLQIVDLEGHSTYLGPDVALRVAVAARDWTHVAALVEPNRVAQVAPDGSPGRVLAQTDRRVEYLSLSPLGDLVIVHDGKALWSVPYAGGPLRKLAVYAGELNSVEWAPDMHSIALIGHRKDVTLVELATGATRELRGHTDAIYTGTFTRDGRGLLTASDDGTARVWNVADGSSIVLRGHDDDVYRARFSPDEKTVATASLDGSVRIWSIDHPGARVLPEGGPIDWLTLQGDTALVKTSSTLARWDVSTGKREPLFSWAEMPSSLGIGVPSPDGSALLIYAANWTLEVRRASGAPVVLGGHTALVSHVAWSRDSKTVYSSSFDGTLRKWDPTTGKSTAMVDGHVPVRGFAVAADGRIAAQVGDSTVLVRADATSETLGTGPSGCALMAEFEKVRDRLILQRCDHSLVLIDGKHEVELPTDGRQITRTAVSPDGQRIAAAMNDRTVRLWDTSGKLLAILRGHTDLVMDVAFSPDGMRLASSSYDMTVRIWELGTDRHRVLRGHSAAVNHVAWRGPDQLVTGSQDGTLRVWTVPATALPSRAEMMSRLDAATSADIDADNRATTSTN
ncbi:MAG: WD-repeat protein [Myxococcales bacterium]|nr:WD-repeat protein [Myxococcales bacterium]